MALRRCTCSQNLVLALAFRASILAWNTSTHYRMLFITFTTTQDSFKRAYVDKNEVLYKHVGRSSVLMWAHFPA
jgi:hypothetical protein